jgi:hypothetical protein
MEWSCELVAFRFIHISENLLRKVLQLLVFPLFSLTLLISYSKFISKTSGDGVSGHFECDIINHLLFTLPQTLFITEMFKGSQCR